MMVLVLCIRVDFLALHVLQLGPPSCMTDRPVSLLHQLSVFMKATSYDYNVAKPLTRARNNRGKITTLACCVRGHQVQ